ncbi:MAG: hypothetical protein QOI81_1474 [Actinomycetota bacterium]|nr:hypothetical protein [Actinomycetota bacterium]
MQVPSAIGAAGRPGAATAGTFGPSASRLNAGPPSASGIATRHPARWGVIALAIVVLAGGAWFVSRPKAISLPLQLEGSTRTNFREFDAASPFGDHPPAHILQGGYGTDPAAPGSFAVEVWIVDKGRDAGSPAQVLTLALPPGLVIDMDHGASAAISGADFECARATSTATPTTICGWSGPTAAGLIGSRQTDLQAALAMTERIEAAVGA